MQISHNTNSQQEGIKMLQLCTYELFLRFFDFLLDLVSCIVNTDNGKIHVAQLF